MIRGLLRLGALGAVVAYAADRVLAVRRGDALPSPIRSLVVIEAPIERVWTELVDVEGQTRWMREMKSVRMTTPGPLGVGSRGEAVVRIFGIGVTDPVEVVEFSPPHRYAVRHEGTFTGGGVIELAPGADGRSTIVTWDETLIPPFLPDLGAVLQRPILGAIFQADLHHFRELLETPAVSPSEERAQSDAATTGLPAASA